ncbi:MAG: PE-PPE domain-containing protein [Mycobacterium sp.]
MSVPTVMALSAAPSVVAATVIASEGTWRPTGEAQSGFSGAFCEQNVCRSLGTGSFSARTTSRQIQTAVDATPGDIILLNYSLGAAGMYDRMREWERNPDIAPDPDRVLLIVTYGNPERKYGGDNRNNPGAGLPTIQPYQHLDAVVQYDSVADSPTRFGFYSAINAAFSRHFGYFDEGVDINDPNNLVFQEGNTTYMLIPAETLPMLNWVRPFVSEERLAELDARYRPLVERDYDRPDYIQQGEGADWGNGKPPPSVSGAGEQEELSEEPESSTETVVVENEANARTMSSLRAVEEDDEQADDETEQQESTIGEAADGSDDEVQSGSRSAPATSTDKDDDDDDKSDASDERDDDKTDNADTADKSTKRDNEKSQSSDKRDSGASSEAA